MLEGCSRLQTGLTEFCWLAPRSQNLSLAPLNSIGLYSLASMVWVHTGAVHDAMSGGPTNNVSFSVCLSKCFALAPMTASVLVAAMNVAAVVNV